MGDNWIMNEKLKDKIAIAWSMFGALTLGTIFMLGSIRITGNVAKIYDVVSTTWSFLTVYIGVLFIGLIIYGGIKDKF